jgi:hypothetical protein
MSATQVKFRGGTTTEHAGFAGADREMTIDTTKNTVVVHDNSGVVGGGHPLCRVGLDGRTDLDISNHETITVTSGGAVTATSFGGDGSALTNLDFTDITNIIPTATASVLGGIIVGNNLNITANGVLSAASSYSLPTATSSVLGGIKVGENLTIDAATGVLSGDLQPQSASDFNHDDLNFNGVEPNIHIDWVADQSPSKQVHVNNVQANWRTQSALWENANSIGPNSPGVISGYYTIGQSRNAFSAGPIAIDPAVSVVMSGTSTWVVL